MALTAVFTADISGLDKALKTATVSLKTFDNATKSATRDLKRELESISGQKLAAEALRMAEAVKRLGGEGQHAAGLLKLLPQELERVRASIDQTIKKADLMGQEVPDDIRKMHAELAKIPKATDAMGASLTKGASAGSSAMSGLLGVARGLLPVLSVGTVVAFGKSMLDSAGQITDLAKATGLSTDAIQEMQYVAGQTGTSMEAFTGASFKLGVTLQQGTDKARESVTALGLSFETLKSQTPEEQFRTVVKALEQVEDVQERNALGVALFGKKFTEIAAAVAQGYSGMADAASKSSKEQLAALDRAGDAFDAFVNKTVTGSKSIAGSVILAIQKIFDLKAITELEEGLRKGANIEAGLPVGGPRREADIKLTQEQARVNRDYAKELAAVQAKVQSLTAEQRKQLDAALKLSGATEELAGEFNLTEQELRIYTSATKDAAKATADLFSGDVIKRAGELAMQLGDVGNVSKLTADKKKELHAAVMKALEAYQALGKEAPQRLKEIAAATTDLITVTKSFASSTSGAWVPLKEGVKDAGAAMQNIAAGLEANGNLMSRSINEAGLAAQAADKAFADWARTSGAELAPSIEAVSSSSQGVAKAAKTMTQELGDVFKGIPMTLARAFEGGGDWAGAFKSIGSQIGAILGKFAGEALGKVLGKAIGGTIGAAFGPIGAAVGEAIGSLVGPLIGKLHDAFTVSASEDVMRRVGQSWGVSISEGLADEIAETAKTLGGANLFEQMRGAGADRQAAEILHFADILREAGGEINATNFDQFIARFRDVFVMFQEGRLSLEQTQQVLDESFGAFAKHIVDSGNVATREFVELIRLNAQLGTQSKAIADFVTEQAGRAATALATMFEGANTEEEFRRFEVLALGAFNAAIEGGASMAEALRAMGPSLDKLVEGFAALGIEASAALQPLLVAHQVAETTAGAAAGALNEAILALSNFGALNEQTLDALEGQLGTIFSRVQAEVAKVGGTHADALRQIVPFLQQALRASEEFGLALDPATRELIDQARELGILGEAAESETDIMKDGFEDVVNAVQDLERALRGLPPIIRDIGNAANDIEFPKGPIFQPPGAPPGAPPTPPFDPTRPQSTLGGRVSALVNTGGAQALTLMPVFVHGQASASEIERAMTSQLPVALATGQPRAAVTTLARLAAEEAIARGR